MAQVKQNAKGNLLFVLLKNEQEQEVATQLGFTPTWTTYHGPSQAQGSVLGPFKLGQRYFVNELKKQINNLVYQPKKD